MQDFAVATKRTRLTQRYTLRTFPGRALPAVRLPPTLGKPASGSMVVARFVGVEAP
jgi:hypothetical protein